MELCSNTRHKIDKDPPFCPLSSLICTNLYSAAFRIAIFVVSLPPPRQTRLPFFARPKMSLPNLYDRLRQQVNSTFKIALIQI